MTIQSQTPRTDAKRELATNKSGIHEIVRIEFARTLELELNAANLRIAELSKRYVACVWCGHTFESDIQSQAEHLYAHAKVRDKHPIKALERRIAELEKDKKRLEWGMIHPEQFRHVASKSHGGFVEQELVRCRQAIDNAIGKEK